MIPEPTRAAAPQPGVPPGYQEVLYWKISDKPSRLVALQILAIPLLVLTGGIFFGLASILGALPGGFSFSTGGVILAIVSIVLTIILHELVHGITMRALGARPQYGVMWDKLMFYATSPGHAYRRAGYIAVALAPLLALSVVAVLGMMLFAGSAWVVLLALCATMNASGAIGDLWILTVVLRYPSHAYVVDERDGVRIFLPSRQGDL